MADQFSASICKLKLVPVTAAFTVTTTSSLALAPELSFTVSLNVYTPAIRFVIVDCAAVVVLKLAVDGPLTSVHLYEAIVPSASEAVHDNCTLDGVKILV